MTLYSIALFLHIVGALLLFVLLTIEGISLRQGFTAARLNRVLGPISALAILVPGLYMSVTPWGWRGWIVAGLAVWVLIALGGAVTGINRLAGRWNTGRMAPVITSARLCNSPHRCVRSTVRWSRRAMAIAHSTAADDESPAPQGRSPSSCRNA